ncbi:MAG: thermonuclease family protein [Planctomycetota bacterium]|jgi:micrococcal nuclease
MDRGDSLEHKPTAQPADFSKYHANKFTVINIVDGDTIDIDVPDGAYEKTRIRLWGIDTPETKSKKYGKMYFGTEATDFTTKLAMGKRVTVYLDQGNETRGKYGRLLGYIQLPDGNFLNEILISEGFAYADLRFRHSYYNKYKQSEALARKQKKGLWNKVTHEQLPQWLQRKKPDFLLKRK